MGRLTKEERALRDAFRRMTAAAEKMCVRMRAVAAACRSVSRKGDDDRD